MQPKMNESTSVKLSIRDDQPEHSAAPSDLQPTISTDHANDANPTAGDLLRSLKTPPAFAPVWAAVILSACWCGLYLWLSGFDAWRSGGGGWARALVEVGAPVLLILTLGELIRRIHQFRTIARVMCLSAHRLTDPVDTAAGKVVSLSSAIRRETAALSESLDSKYTRGQTLRASLRDDLSLLISSHEEAEARLRDIIRSVAHERDALAQQTKGLSSSVLAAKSGLCDEIRDAQLQISAEMGRAISMLREITKSEVEELRSLTAQHSAIIEENLDKSTFEIRDAFQTGAARLEKIVAREISAVEDRLTQTTVVCTHQLNHVGDQIIAQMHTTSASIISGIAEQSGRVTGSLKGLQQDMLTHLDSQAINHSRAMDHSVVQLTQAFELSSKRAADAISGTAERMSTHGAEIAVEFERAGEHVVAALDKASRRVEGMIETLDVAMIGDLAQKVENLESTVTVTTQKVSDAAQVASQSFVNAMEHTMGGIENLFASFRDRLKDLEAILAAKVGVDATSTVQRFDAISQAINTNIDSQTRSITDFIERSSHAMSTEVAKALEHANSSITDTSIRARTHKTVGVISGL
jgi:hypothetical protein